MSHFLEAMPLLSLPVSNKNTRNRHKLENYITDMMSVTSADLIEKTGMCDRTERHIFIIGKLQKMNGLLHQLILGKKQPFILLASIEDLNESIDVIDFKYIDWEMEVYPGKQESIPQGGNGVIAFHGTPEEQVENLKQTLNCLNKFSNVTFILFLSGHLPADMALMNGINGLGTCIIITDSFSRCVTNDLTPEQLLNVIDCIVVTSPDTCAIKALVTMMPSFEKEIYTNSLDLTVHTDSPMMYEGQKPHRGNGVRLNQARSLQTSPLLDEENIMKLINNGKLVILNRKKSHVWTAHVIR